MASLKDPFDAAVGGSPDFIESFPVAERTALVFLTSVGFAGAAVVAVALGLHATGPVGRGVYSCMVLLAVALGASLKLMLLFARPSSLRRALVGCAALIATAALVSTFSLAEMLALAFVRTATADPLAGDAEKLTALFAASFILLGVLGLLAAAVRKTTRLPGALAPVTLCVAALPALMLYSLSLQAIAVIAAASLMASAALILRTLIK